MSIIEKGKKDYYPELGYQKNMKGQQMQNETTSQNQKQYVKEDQSLKLYYEVFEKENIVKIDKNHLKSLKQTIKELQKLLNMRLRVEQKDSLEIIQELNSRLLFFFDIEDQLQNSLKVYQEKIQDVQYLSHKSQKYDNLVLRLDDVESQYQQKNVELENIIEKYEEQFKCFKQREIEKQDNIEYLQQQLQEYKVKVENIQSESESKDAEINRLKMEKDSIKRQQQNLSSLLKQVNEEKEVQSQKMGSDIEQKLEGVKEDLEKVKEVYQAKVDQKQQKIDKLERELQLVKSELELNQEFTFLQSSVNSTNRFQQSSSQSRFQESLGYSQSQRSGQKFKIMHSSSKKPNNIHNSNTKENNNNNDIDKNNNENEDNNLMFTFNSSSKKKRAEINEYSEQKSPLGKYKKEEEQEEECENSENDHDNDNEEEDDLEQQYWQYKQQEKALNQSKDSNRVRDPLQNIESGGNNTEDLVVESISDANQILSSFPSSSQPSFKSSKKNSLEDDNYE